jgi:hypothetical protein
LPPYRSADTYIEYRTGFAEQAERISREMPTPARLVAVKQGAVDVRVVIGRDIQAVSACSAWAACSPGRAMMVADATPAR